MTKNKNLSAEDLAIITTDMTGAQAVAEGLACEALAKAYDDLADERLADAREHWDPAWGRESSFDFELWAATEFCSPENSYRAAMRSARAVRSHLAFLAAASAPRRTDSRVLGPFRVADLRRR